MKRIRNGSGFTVVEALLILILLAILGFTGLYVIHAQNDANKTLDTASKTAASSTPVQTTKVKNSTDSSKATVDTKVQKAMFSSAPAAIKAAVLANAKSQGCVNQQGQLTDDSDASVEDTDTVYFVDKTAAFLGECHSKAFYAYASGEWKFIAKTQFGFNCSDLKQYKVPVALAAAALPDNGQCLDSSNNLVNYTEQ